MLKWDAHLLTTELKLGRCAIEIKNRALFDYREITNPPFSG